MKNAHSSSLNVQLGLIVDEPYLGQLYLKPFPRSQNLFCARVIKNFDFSVNKVMLKAVLNMTLPGPVMPERISKKSSQCF